MPTIAAIYASLLAFGFIWLSAQVISVRQGESVAFGEGGKAHLTARVRAHANFAEYVPIALILLVCAELQGAIPWLLHACGAALIAGRILHARGLTMTSHNIPLRVAGMATTFTVLGVLAFTNLWLSYRQLS